MPTAALIERWHGKGRQLYAITPRFAITSTEEQLEAAGALLARASRLLHADASRREPQTRSRPSRRSFRAPSYTDVYDRFGLLGPRSLLGHCIHLGDDEMRACSRDSRSVAVFCPTSNLFIGSGPVRL